MCSAEKFGAASSERTTDAILPPISTIRLVIFLPIIGKSGAVFTKDFCISTRFCTKYRTRRNLLKTKHPKISTRGHNHL